MKKQITKLFNNCKGSLDFTSVVVDVILIVALIPVIIVFISGGENSYICPTSPFTSLVNNSICQNVTGTTSILATHVGLSVIEATLLGLVGLFLVLGLVFAFVKQSGLMEKKG